MKRLNKKGIIFFSTMLFIGLILSAMDFANMYLFISSKAVAVAFILISGNLLINSIDKE